MMRNPQRRLLWLSLMALIWGAGLVALVWVDTEPPLLLTAWCAGAALLVMLAFYLGLLFRLDVLQMQQILRERLLAPAASQRDDAPVSAIWQPLVDVVAAIRPALDQAKDDKARLDALASALEAERARGLALQRQVAQAEARLAALRGQAQQAAQALSSLESAWLNTQPWPDAPTGQGKDKTDLAGQSHVEAFQALEEAVEELQTAMEAQAAAMNERDAAIRAYVQAREATSEQSALQQRRYAERLAQSAEALTLLGLNLRLQLSHLASDPAAEGLPLEQTETDLDALLASAGEMNLQTAPALDDLPTVPEPFPNQAATNSDAAQARLRASLNAVAQAIAAAQQAGERQRLHQEHCREALGQRTAARAEIQTTVSHVRETLGRAVRESVQERN